MRRVFAFLLVSGLLFSIGFAGAVEEVGKQEVPVAPETVSTVEGLVGVVDTVGNWIFTIFLIVAVIFILLAAWQFVTAGGNSTAVGEARMKIMYAAIGILVALGAQAIPAVIANILGVEEGVVEVVENGGGPPPGGQQGGQDKGQQAGEEQPPQEEQVAEGSFGSTPSSWDFLSILVGESVEKTFTIANNTQEPVTLKSASLKVAGPYSAQGFSKNKKLDPGEMSSFSLRFEPKSAGTFENEMVIAADPASRSFSLQLMGAGTEAALFFTLAGGEDAFQRADPGQQAQWHLKIANSGKSKAAGELKFSNSAFACAGDGCKYAIDPGRSADALVSFTPPQGSRGTLSSHVQATAGSEVAAEFDLGVRVNALIPNPDPLDFGTVQAGASKSLSLTVTNDTQGEVFVQSIRENTFNVPPFVVEKPTGKVLQPGEAFTTNVTFEPDAPGTFLRSLTISDGEGAYTASAEIRAVAE